MRTPAQMAADPCKGLSSEEIEKLLSPAGGEEHVYFTRVAWRNAVINDDTIAGYWDWVCTELESEEPIC